MVSLTHYKLDSQYFVYMKERDRILSATVSQDKTELTSPVQLKDTIPDSAEEIDQLEVPSEGNSNILVYL